MSSAWSFSSFGLEENLIDEKLKENFKEDKSKRNLVHNKEDIFNDSFRDVDIFMTDKQRPPMMIKTKRIKRFLPNFSNLFKTDNDNREVNHSQHEVHVDKWMNSIDTSKSRWTRNKVNAINSCFLVKAKEMREFFKLTEDAVINDFFKMDSCKRISDKYLIAMVFAYFKRANFTTQDYNRMNFFIALYLANDVEEDEEEIKYEILPWALGKDWKQIYINFLRKRDLLFRRIDYRAIVSRKCCDEIMNIEPDNLLWKRERCLHHAGAIRGYMKDPKDNGVPRGPDASPLYCPNCDITDSQYDSASPNSLSWIISPCESLNDSRVYP